MRRNSFLLVALSSLALGCGIPGRANPADPANAPEAIVNVYLRQADGTDHAGTEGGQQTLFVFDASESFDPHGGSELTIAWDLTDPRWDVGDVGDFETASNEGPAKLVTKLPLTRTMLAHDGISTGVGIAPRDVRLRVKTPDGSKAYATASVLLRNAAPILETGGPVTASPVDLPVVMLDACGGIAPPSCTTRDPDGDPLTFTWEQTRGEPVALTATGGDGGARTLFQPTGDRPLEFRVTADDGVAATDAYVSVRFSPQIWVSTDTPSRLYRVHPELTVRDRYRAPGATPLTAIGAIAAHGGRIAITQSGGNAVVSLDRDFRLEESWVLGTEVSELVVASGGNVCARSANGFHELIADGSTAAHVDPSAAAVLRASSGCWTVGATLGRFSGGAWNEVAATGELRGAAVLPDETLWVLTAEGALLRLDPGASSLVSVTVPFEPGSIESHPDGESLLAFDAITGLPWRIAKSGASDVDDDLPALGPVDPRGGAIWEIDGSTVRHHRLHGATWVEENAPLDLPDVGAFSLNPSAVDIDDESIVGVSGLSIVRLPSHLTRSRLVASFDEAPIITADPSSGAVWVEAGDGLQRVVGGRVVASAEVGSSRLARSLPNGDAWVDPFDGSYSLARLDRYGVEQERISLDDRAVTYLDRFEDTLCIATDDYTGNGALVRVDLSQSPPSVHPLSVEMDYAVGAAAGPDGDCWFSGIAGTGDPDHLVYVPGGQTTASTSQIALLSCGGRLAADPRGSGLLAPCSGVVADTGFLANCQATDAGCLDRWAIQFDRHVLLRDGAGVVLQDFVLGISGTGVEIEVVP